MSKYTRSRHAKDTVHNTQSMLAKVQSELADRYVEVEAEGLSFTRLACIYIAGAREARDRMLEGVRSLFGLKHAH
jgi:hypothetical protein